MGSADTQQAAYRHLAPLQGEAFLQLGGSGSHAVKALLAGARCAGLLSPSLGEVKLGYALAERFGVADRFFGVVGIGELIPFADASLERVYGGGCLHHTELKHSLPDVARVLKEGGRASFVDPQENPIYSTWSHLLGRARFCGEEDDTHDHPLDLDELTTLTDGLFQERELYASGGLARYGLLVIERTTERALPIPLAAALFKAERAALKALKLSRLFGNVAVMLTR
jgi:SAM-dependent methyltransferase